MRTYLDFEFVEDGRTIEPVSVGLAAEDGRTYYAEFEEALPLLAGANPWVAEHVVPLLEGGAAVRPRRRIREEIVEFFAEVRGGAPPGRPDIWGYYAAYDWVAFCQLFGTMMELPKGWPMYARDLKQRCDELGNPGLPPKAAPEHHALNDAAWERDAHAWLERTHGGPLVPISASSWVRPEAVVTVGVCRAAARATPGAADRALVSFDVNVAFAGLQGGDMRWSGLGLEEAEARARAIVSAVNRRECP